jgi:hypothetical protein
MSRNKQRKQKIIYSYSSLENKNVTVTNQTLQFSLLECYAYQYAISRFFYEKFQTKNKEI